MQLNKHATFIMSMPSLAVVMRFFVGEKRHVKKMPGGHLVSYHFWTRAVERFKISC
jgi:hypothetical protein